jgi:hypoxanthine-guanine phosphoribosyltransferase
MEILKKYGINILMAIAMVVWGWIQKGATLEFKEKVGEVMTEKINSKDFMDKVMTSSYMKEYKEVEKLKTLKEVVKVVDSEKVDFIQVLSLKTGLTKDAISDSLAERIGEKRLTEKQVVELIRKYNRRMVRL